jgi:hypothetical protein
METAVGTPRLYLVRDPEPLGTYFRPAARDYAHFANLLASGHSGGSGIVAEGRSLTQPHAAELRDAALRSGMQVILDPLGVEMASPTGWMLPGLKEMPWVPRKRFVQAHYTADERAYVASELATATMEFKASAVLAPARLVEQIEHDSITRDVELAIALREALDGEGGNAIRIYYPLATSLQIVASTAARQGILATLRNGISAGAIDAIWVRAARFGMSAGPTNLRRYVSGVRGLHELGVPIVGDRAGTLGLGMVALGVTCATTSGITTGERFEPRELFRPRSGKAFALPPRVYISAIGAFTKRAQAEVLLKHPSLKNWVACQRPCCAGRGMSETLADPRRHFVVTRVAEVRDLAQVPQGLRAAHYMEHWLRRASDRATTAMRIDPTLHSHRVHLDALRGTFAAIIEEDSLAESPVSRSAIQMPASRGA